MEENISLSIGDPVALLGENECTGVQAACSRVLDCTTVWVSFGWHLMTILKKLEVDRDHAHLKYGPTTGNYCCSPWGYVAAIDTNPQLLLL